MQFLNFGPRSVLVAFDGGEITSDAGALLLRKTVSKLKLFPRLANVLMITENRLGFSTRCLICWHRELQELRLVMKT